ncbi:protein of unknown function DUF214 [Beutenbergia cavernae DSM 12333]|uniref:ABC3 transporter permease C-terminal domain-containing protein n=1 Tax=Beutenbergia cavernae (strain ATCC BAA-8 / DSM 12333 / CCUG 43141 / JCM 11478 / NBRC 16432 / NCIMB 13614 / HKI 0122) TaxID=471853 RepID=C5C642_BEUC1|nr:FtsX-like permease family protein [Beutenbergia cavernae]ACQ82400.1 protein of unknown function DUF214 [Beutenbergia cavernae DSM 12333]
MSPHLLLGWRLVRAGGWTRALSVAIGALVATVFAMVALAIPTAVYPPDAGILDIWQANVTAALLFALAPAAVLLVTTTRISSAIRDRRLESLRLIGLSRGGATTVAATESGTLAGAGAVAGSVMFVALGPVADRIVAAGPAWFAAPLHLDTVVLLAAVLGVVAVSAAIGAAPMMRSHSPLQGRSPATRRRPTRWRLAVPGVATAMLGTLVVRGEAIIAAQPDAGITLLVGGAVLAAVGVAVATPVLADWSTALLVRSGSVPAVLAGRGIQAEPLATTRIVAGLAVALLLVLGGNAVLLAFESTPQYRSALQALTTGPQSIRLHPEDPRTTPLLSLDDVAAIQGSLDGVPGVEQVFPSYDVEAVGCDPMDGCFTRPFVGTCDQLAAVMAVTGCVDGQAGYIGAANVPDDWGSLPERGASDRLELRFAGVPPVSVPLGPDLTQDWAATEERWVYPAGHDYVIPPDVAAQAGAGALFVTVIAEGGTEVRDRVAAALPSLAQPEEYWNDSEVAAVGRVRLVIYTLSSMAIGTALLGLALTAFDHARERRRTVARQVAAGVPPRTLYAGQVLQVFTPLLAAVALSTALGWLLVRAWSAASGWPALTDGSTLALAATVTIVGGALVALLTIPAVRTRLTPELLRRE